MAVISNEPETRELNGQQQFNVDGIWLAACPWCGNPPEIRQTAHADYTARAIRCVNYECKPHAMLSTHNMDDLQELAQVWNTRFI